MLSVLLVDDEPLVLEGLRIMIDWNAHGFEINGEASTGYDALNFIRSYHPDLVVTDIQMPDLTGLQLIQQVKETMKNPPRFIILSGYNNFAFAQTAMRSGIHHYLLKPIDETEMDPVLDKLCQEIQAAELEERSNERRRTLLTNQLITRMIRGEEDAEFTQRCKQLLGIVDGETIACMLLEVDRSHNEDGACREPDMRAFKYRFQLLIEDHYPEQLIHVFMDGNERVGVLFRGQAGLPVQLTTLVNQYRDQLLISKNSRLSVFVSDGRRGIDAIKVIYEQALAARNLQVYKENGGVFYFKALQGLKISSELGETDLSPLYKAIEQQDHDEMNLLIQQIFISFHAKHVAESMVHLFVANLKMNLLRIITGMNDEADHYADHLRFLSQSWSGTGLFALEQHVRGICIYTADQLEHIRWKNAGNTIHWVIEYINQNYHKKLKLCHVAEQFAMNSTYLGQLFKKTSGMSFNEYINVKRIEEAKKLLIRTPMKVADIAVAVGYQDSDYFVCKFKEATNCLPSAFKKTYREDGRVPQ
ncbi:MAG: response regulator [Gorillibacterium sp.]|nr:response regulator [Gorillibacterium sp.]